MWSDNTPTPLNEIRDPLLSEKGVKLLIKRDDIIHPRISGNKWRKLKLNLQQAIKTKKTIATYGGAYSNHIAATAEATKIYGIPSIGIIRGDELKADSNETLKKASSNGMNLFFVERSTYRELTASLLMPSTVKEKNLMIIPEGGSNSLAIEGCAEIISELNTDFDIICTPIGTGGTFSGILKMLDAQKHVYGFSALKGLKNIDGFLRANGIENKNFRIFDEDVYGGYAKYNDELIEFILDFHKKFDLLLDPIYTGKMFFRVWELVKNDQIARNSTIVLVHTGGLQGITAFNHRYGLSLPIPKVL